MERSAFYCGGWRGIGLGLVDHVLEMCDLVDVQELEMDRDQWNVIEEKMREAVELFQFFGMIFLNGKIRILSFLKEILDRRPKDTASRYHMTVEWTVVISHVGTGMQKRSAGDEGSKSSVGPIRKV